MFKFTVTHTCSDSRARTGTLETPHGTIQTPVFMPVGTVGSVKTLDPTEVEQVGAEIILGNTYHLYLRPGEKLIKQFGGLHKWIGWNHPILTDSGGFQVFSLGLEDRPLQNNVQKTSVKISNDGVEFQSHIDGSRHFFTPEKAIQIQTDLGSDIMMAFDECAPADSTKSYAQSALDRTHAWVIRCKKEWEKLQQSAPLPQALFPIIQGCLFEDLRIESTKFMADLDLPGIAIGGLSVGESKTDMHRILETIYPHLPEQKPRYLMGVGTPEDLFECIDRGIDMFDCVLPTRIARHGAFWTEYGRQNIKRAEYREDSLPLMQNCSCSTCTRFSRSYIRHLFLEKEVLGLRLITIHNLHFLIHLVSQMRKHISDGTFSAFKKTFFETYKTTDSSKE